ncbi:MAG: cell division protein FtsZ [Rhodobacteraceae bacterium]|nr:cell division protein FtsZ [Paracoccaceae bacterium]
MALNISIVEREELKPRITVFGVGGAGGNAVNNMIEKNLDGVEFVVANTDAQALQQSRSDARIQMGVQVTEGLGAGARPSVGSAAAEETIEEIVDHLAGVHMCFITAGMGGGTGTGAAPIIAQAARELGVLTVGVVTKPFQFEGAKRMRIADEGIEALQKVVDTLIIIPNQNLFRLANEKTTFTEAFAMADDVLYQGVKGVTDLMVRPGLINLDFADVRSVMDEMGKAMMGTGEASGEDRAIQAAEKAIANPLLDEISLRGAKGVLINITGGYDLTLFELDEAANRIREEVDPDANIIVGSTLDSGMEGMMRVSVVATGIDAKPATAAAPATRRSMAATGAPKPAEQPAIAPAAQFSNDMPLTAAEQAEDLFDSQDDGDALPEPAYRPDEAPEEPAAEAAPEPAQEAAFVAPRPRAPGTPTPEALARLQAAVGRSTPRGPVNTPPARSPATPRSVPAAPAADARPAAGGDRQRFGINALLNRMTGHATEPQAGQPPRAAPQVPPSAGFEEDSDLDSDKDRIEIPAFLRRQAN